MKNKPLIIIVISAFLIAGIFGSEKRLIKPSDISRESSRAIKVELTPHNDIRYRLGLIDSYRPIYTRRLDLQKNELENPLRPTE